MRCVASESCAESSKSSITTNSSPPTRATKSVWSYNFIEDKTYNGKKIRFLNIIDEFGKECLASITQRCWQKNDIIEVLSGLMVTRGCPGYLRSDNGPEFISKNSMLGHTFLTLSWISQGLGNP
jgi:hypothetical protein